MDNDWQQWTLKFYNNEVLISKTILPGNLFCNLDLSYFAKKNFQDNLFYNLELSYTPKEIASKLKVYLKSILICKTKLNLNKFVCLSDDQSHLLYFAH